MVQYLRSSQDTFTLQKYKEELGKPYSKIYLYLCAVRCLQRAETDFVITDDEIRPEKVKGHTSTDAQIRPVKRA